MQLLTVLESYVQLSTGMDVPGRAWWRVPVCVHVHLTLHSLSLFCCACVTSQSVYQYSERMKTEVRVCVLTTLPTHIARTPAVHNHTYHFIKDTAIPHVVAHVVADAVEPFLVDLPTLVSGVVSMRTYTMKFWVLACEALTRRQRKIEHL